MSALNPDDFATLMVGILDAVRRFVEAAEAAGVPTPTEGMLVSYDGVAIRDRGDIDPKKLLHEKPPGYRAEWRVGGKEPGVACLDIYFDSVEFVATFGMDDGRTQNITEEWTVVEEIDYVALKYALEQMGFTG